MVTTLRELTERFGGLEGNALDEFGRAHPISLEPFAAAAPRYHCRGDRVVRTPAGRAA